MEQLIMARTMTAQQAAVNWQKGMSGAGEKLKAGVAAVTESPMAKAAAAADRMIAGVTQAVTSGKWASRLMAVPLQAWKDAMTTKGAANIAAGAQKAQPKVLSFQTQWLPFIQGIVGSLPPRGDLETNIARATSVMRAASNFNYQKSG